MVNTKHLRFYLWRFLQGSLHYAHVGPMQGESRHMAEVGDIMIFGHQQPIRRNYLTSISPLLSEWQS